MEQQKTILLTGGNGFVGRNIRESYLSDKYSIIAPGSKDLNLLDALAVDAFFGEHKIDIVLHAAIKPGHRNAVEQDNLFFKNTQMFFNLEKQQNKFEKMITFGSGAIYDMRNYRDNMQEEEVGNFIPIDEYGFSKYVCQKCIQNSAKIIDLYIFGIFGKYEDYAIRFISNMICKSLFDLPLTMNQNRFFSYLYVEDLMPILDFFIQNNLQYKSYNMTPDAPSSLFELAQIVQEISGKNLPIIVKKEGLKESYTGNNTRLKETIPELKLTPIQQSIETLYEWYKVHKDSLDKNVLLIDK